MKAVIAVSGIRISVDLDAAEVARIVEAYDGRYDERLRDALEKLDDAVHKQLFAALDRMKSGGIEVAR